MSSTLQMTGSIVALVTPMFADGSIDWDALTKLCEWHIAEGTNTIAAVGTTGESATLDVEEHAKVIEHVVRVVNKRVLVMAGTGANSTREAIELTQTALDLGADAVLLVTPYYNKPTQEGLYQHYKAISDAVNIPQMLYNVPGRTGVDMHNDTVLRLADEANIFAIKDATGDLVRGKDLVERLNGKLAVFSGDDATASQLIGFGAKGNVSVTANIAPRAMSQLCASALAGDTAVVTTIDQQLATLNRVLFCESNPIPVKFALAKMGKIENAFRLPLTPLNVAYHAEVTTALTDAGLL